ncbi:MAG: leucine-rich repeat domain-containing protein, partial [Paludibacteraceae bacterium]|nr:leucine-rich repeat domain-containing protein [Paludibacteraceae bacterium]
MKKHLLLTLIALLSVGLLWAAKPAKKQSGKKAPAKKEVKKETKKPSKKEAKNAAGEDPYGNTIAVVDSLFYILDDEKETATVTVPTDPSFYVGVKEIPEVIKYKRNLYSVNEIGEGAFEGCKGLTGVKFPETVVSIGDRAFKDCAKLKNLSFPADLVSVGEEAFMNSGIRAAKLPKSVIELGDRAFAGTPIKSASFGREMT